MLGVPAAASVMAAAEASGVVKVTPEQLGINVGYVATGNWCTKVVLPRVSMQQKGLHMEAIAGKAALLSCTSITVYSLHPV